MTRTQRFLLSLLVVVSVPVGLYFFGAPRPAPPAVPPMAPPPAAAPPRVAAPPPDEAPPALRTPADADLSGYWRGTWERGSHRVVYGFHLAHRRPEGFLHARGTAMLIRDGVLVDSIITLAFGGQVEGRRIELGAPPPWTAQTPTGTFAGTLGADGRSARGEVMGPGGTVLPLELRLITPALNHAAGAYSAPQRLTVPGGTPPPGR